MQTTMAATAEAYDIYKYIENTFICIYIYIIYRQQGQLPQRHIMQTQVDKELEFIKNKMLSDPEFLLVFLPL